MATIKTSTGLIHTADRGFYAGDIAETGVMPVQAVKRGRGRPRKDAGEAGVKFDFSAFMTKVNVPGWTGPVRQYTKLSK